MNDNNMSGPLPPAVFNMSSFGRIQLEGNKFSGVLPSEIGNMQGLMILGIQNNSFIGKTSIYAFHTEYILIQPL